MTKHKNKPSQGKSVRFILLGLVGLGLIIATMLRGSDVVLLNPKGAVAGEQLKLMIFSATLLLTIAVPTLFFLYFFAWKYRESNEKAMYSPHARHGKFFVLSMWAIPTVSIAVLAVVMWSATLKLEPQKPIASNAKPLIVQVVALRWKWLFIYPEHNIATINYVQVPTGIPVQFELTADEAPMSSFWIPHLGGQLYAMTGHSNRLNLIADTPGDYPGRSAEINGAGFAGMKFIARASSKEDFALWIQDVRLTSAVLDWAGYEKLLRPSEYNLAEFYAMAETDLYDKVLMKYRGSHDHNTGQE